MKTRFNLASSPLENNRRFIAGSCALGTLALVALAFLSVHAYRTWRSNRQIRSEISRVDSQIEKLQGEQDSLRAELKSPQATAEMARSVYLNGLIEQRAFPWTKMFADLERILPPGVRVFSISPKRDKVGNITVALIAGAANDDAKLKFLEALETSRQFSHVQPKEESRPSKSDAAGDSVVLISLDARYATSEDPPAPRPTQQSHAK